MTREQAVEIVARMLNEKADRHFEEAKRLDRADYPKSENSPKERTDGQYARTVAVFVRRLK